MHSIINSLEWRYATKKFDPTKKIKADDFEQILKALSLSASSYGLQPYKFFVVENQELRQELVQHSWNQRQVADASHLLVMASRTAVDKDFVQDFNELFAKYRGIGKEQVANRTKFMVESIEKRSPEEIANWCASQTYIALGNLLTVCADMRIDTCPMEGFSKAAYNKLLGLENTEYTSTLVCPIGYRSTDDQTQNARKVRRQKLVEIIK
ncbi:MAG: NAD(P)H-dependent oxidoreductase [Bacteroidetes bacterium]|nr:NAD(P)H-dependent oxidoreductase [Bacteroidota bacterium]